MQALATHLQGDAGLRVLRSERFELVQHGAGSILHLRQLQSTGTEADIRDASALATLIQHSLITLEPRDALPMPAAVDSPCLDRKPARTFRPN